MYVVPFLSGRNYLVFYHQLIHYRWHLAVSAANEMYPAIYDAMRMACTPALYAAIALVSHQVVQGQAKQCHFVRGN